MNLIGLDVGEAHGAPELLRHLHTGSGPLSHLSQGEAGGLPQQQILVSRQGGPLRMIRLSDGLTLDTRGALVSPLHGTTSDPVGVRYAPLARSAV